jgi:hypothetical protein
MKTVRVVLAVLMALHSLTLVFYVERLFFQSASVLVLLGVLLSLCITDTVFLGLLRRTFR